MGVVIVYYWDIKITHVETADTRFIYCPHLTMYMASRRFSPACHGKEGNERGLRGDQQGQLRVIQY